MVRATQAEQIGRLDERLKSIEKLLSVIADEQRSASDGRRRIYEAQERTERQVIGLNHRLTAVEKSVEAIRPTTAEVERVRDRVLFAGSLGRALWNIGKVVIGVAAGAAGAWYTLTGRPPP